MYSGRYNAPARLFWTSLWMPWLTSYALQRETSAAATWPTPSRRWTSRCRCCSDSPVSAARSSASPELPPGEFSAHHIRKHRHLWSHAGCCIHTEFFLRLATCKNFTSRRISTSTENVLVWISIQTPGNRLISSALWHSLRLLARGTI